MSKFNDIINSEIPVLIDFYATWCGPCKTMAPILEQLADKVKGKVKILKVDVDKNPVAASAYKIQSVPTLILFYKGQIKWKQSGVVPFIQLQNVLQPFLTLEGTP